MKKVVVEFYTPWCAKCKVQSKEYLKLADSMAQNESFKFLRFDSSENELADFSPKTFPLYVIIEQGKTLNEGM